MAKKKVTKEEVEVKPAEVETDELLGGEVKAVEAKTLAGYHPVTGEEVYL